MHRFPQVFFLLWKFILSFIIYTLTTETLAMTEETTLPSRDSPASTLPARVTLLRPTLTWRSRTISTCSCSSSPWPSSSAPASSVSSAHGLSSLTSKVREHDMMYCSSMCLKATCTCVAATHSSGSLEHSARSGNRWDKSKVFKEVAVTTDI